MYLVTFSCAVCLGNDVGLSACRLFRACLKRWLTTLPLLTWYTFSMVMPFCCDTFLEYISFFILRVIPLEYVGIPVDSVGDLHFLWLLCIVPDVLLFDYLMFCSFIRLSFCCSFSGTFHFLHSFQPLRAKCSDYIPDIALPVLSPSFVGCWHCCSMTLRLLTCDWWWRVHHYFSVSPSWPEAASVAELFIVGGNFTPLMPLRYTHCCSHVTSLLLMLMHDAWWRPVFCCLWAFSTVIDARYWLICGN